jgi:hypothetical protein
LLVRERVHGLALFWLASVPNGFDVYWRKTALFGSVVEASARAQDCEGLSQCVGADTSSSFDVGSL